MTEAGDAIDLNDWIFSNIKKIFFPEEWIKLDQSMSKTQLLALFFLERQGEATMTQLADFLNSPLSTLTGIVDRLVSGGFLNRERTEADRRSIVLCLTESGKAVIHSLKTLISSYIDQIQAILTEEEQATAIRIAAKVMQLMNSDTVLGQSRHTAEDVKRIPIE